MHWLLQENICQERQWDELVYQLKKFKIPYSVHKVVPFSGDLVPEPYVPPNAKVWCVGSLSMIKTCKKNGWEPGCIDLDKCGFDQLKHILGQQLLNYDGRVTTFKKIHEDEVPLYKLNFVRPTDDSKFISGSVMSDIELREWANKIVNIGDDSGSDISEFTKLVVASTKNTMKEYRFWVVNDRVVTWSQYKLGSTVIYDSFVPNPAIEYAERVVKKIRSSPFETRPITYCLDVAEVEGHEYKVIELNNINSSGLYECDIQRLVHSIQQVYNIPSVISVNDVSALFKIDY